MVVVVAGLPRENRARPMVYDTTKVYNVYAAAARAPRMPRARCVGRREAVCPLAAAHAPSGLNPAAAAAAITICQLNIFNTRTRKRTGAKRAALACVCVCLCQGINCLLC